MERVTQTQLRALISSGAARDLEEAHKEARGTGYKYARAITDLRQIGYSSGVYGINGALFRDENGALYAIAQRTSTLFIYA